MRIAIATFVGFAVATVIYASTRFKSPGTSPTWPPPPKAIVSWILAEDLGLGQGNNLTLQPGEEVVAFTVPADRWLVITEVGDVGTGLLRLLQRAPGGGETLKRPSLGSSSSAIAPIDTRDAVGLVFEPGSQVVARNEHGSSIAYIDGNWRWAGYLTR